MTVRDPTAGDDSSMNDKTPRNAVATYVRDITGRLGDNTVATRRSNLTTFCEFCDSREVVHLSDLEKETLRYDLLDWIDQNREWANTTTYQAIYDFSAFLQACEDVDWVEPGMSDALPTVELEDGEDVADDALEPSRVEDCLETIETIRPASARHVTMLLIYHVPCRASGVHSLDLRDYVSADEADGDRAYLRFRHRPETDTTLKNGIKSERSVGLADSVAETLDKYLYLQRTDVTDEHGREPLITSRVGRASTSTITDWVSWGTRRCLIDGECDCDGEIQKSLQEARQCATATPSHPVRKAGIRMYLRAGMDPEYIAERADMSEETLKKHYSDEEVEDMMRRSRFFD